MDTPNSSTRKDRRERNPDRMPRTLAEKIWERHVVHRAEGEPDLLYVDLHLVHEVTSPQAFEASGCRPAACAAPI